MVSAGYLILQYGSRILLEYQGVLYRPKFQFMIVDRGLRPVLRHRPGLPPPQICQPSTGAYRYACADETNGEGVSTHAFAGDLSAAEAGFPSDPISNPRLQY